MNRPSKEICFACGEAKGGGGNSPGLGVWGSGGLGVWRSGGLGVWVGSAVKKGLLLGLFSRVLPPLCSCFCSGHVCSAAIGPSELFDSWPADFYHCRPITFFHPTPLYRSFQTCEHRQFSSWKVVWTGIPGPAEHHITTPFIKP